MSLLDLANALRGQLPATGQGQIMLNKQTLTSANATNIDVILQNIADYLNLSDETPLTIAHLSQSDIPNPSGESTLVISVGQTVFLNTSMSVKTLQFTLHNQELNIVLQTVNLIGTDGSPWTLATSFFEFVIFPILDQSIFNASFIFSTNQVQDWKVTDNVSKDLQVGLNFYAEFNPIKDPVFQSITSFLNFLSANLNTNFHFFGQIDNKNKVQGFTLNFPNLQLTSPVFDETGSFKFFNLFEIRRPRFGVRLIEIPESDDSDCPADITTELYCEFDLIVDENITLDFSLGFEGDEDFFMLKVTSLQPLSLDHVYKLMAGQTWDNLIPSLLQSALKIIDFQGFIATVGITKSSGFNLLCLMIIVGSDPQNPIKLFPPFQDCIFWVRWMLLNPNDKNLQHSSISFEAEIDVDKIGTFNVEIASG